ncbi:hypothetical protein [Caenimonas koreensis]|uniref:Uncharacterized protein n=1 Tax=Caenimonas koreensis DSM 17982 TaxID=1121255 RepID=A0A844BD89_9BURK|nr:hypothetical protein [Caenimonas koreensis]MRD49516.1 hypothetical protein [Caenimonas koreensis DSM 17982]
MGAFMKEHDIYVGSLQEKLNLRFAPKLDAKTKSPPHGLQEMVELQKEFEVFKVGRPFERSIALLNLAGSSNAQVTESFHGYLRSLRKAKSNVAGLTGDAAIVKALVANLSAKKPLPVYFELHDRTASKDSDRVIITESARPLFYMKQDYLVISLPLEQNTRKK